MSQQPQVNQQTPQQPKKPSTQVIVALIGAAAIIIAALITGIFGLAGKEPPSSAGTTPTPIPTLSPLQTPTVQTPPSGANGFFGFENGVENWIAPEMGQKLSTVDTTTDRVHAGAHALRLTTVLIGKGNDAYPGNEVYTHSEAMVYFDQHLPGLNTPGPYDLTGKPVSCFVYLPTALATRNSPQVFIRMTAKDRAAANNYGQMIFVDQSHVEQWFQISLTIGIGDFDATFNPHKVWGIGVLLETTEDSTLNFKGAIYIDDCSVGHT